MAQKSRKTEDEGAGEESPLEALLAQHEGELNKINEEIEAVDKAEGAEIQAVQRKFHKQRLPILHKRNALLKKIPGVWLNIVSSFF
jgi:Skp family chaperone for outer membrane proteins